MKRMLPVVLAGTLLALAGGVTLSMGAPRARVKVCHATRTDGGHVIEVAEPALRAHLNHGDSVEAAAGLGVGDACTFGVGRPE